MKTSAPLLLVTQLFTFVLFATLGAAAQPSGAAEGPQDEPHFLFMGTDVSVEWKNEFHPVRGVRGESFLIRVRERDIEVPMSKGGVNIRMSQALRLTRTTAFLDKFTSARAYTPANDPHRKFHERAAASMGLAELSTNADRTAQAAVRDHQFAQHMSAANSATQQAMADTAAQAQRLESLLQSDAGSLAAHAAHADAELSREWFDALEISCEISARQPLRDPYLIVIARYQEPGAKPGMMRDWIHAEALKNVSERPARVRIKRGGFKPGFQLHNVSVHVYENGREVATNLSRNRVTFTAEEAIKYLLIEYLAQNKDATLTARPIPELWPDDADADLPAQQVSRVYYVIVGKDGLPQASYLDAACSIPTETFIADRIARVRFYPALHQGTPAESATSLRLDYRP